MYEKLTSQFAYLQTNTNDIGIYIEEKGEGTQWAMSQKIGSFTFVFSDSKSHYVIH